MVKQISSYLQGTKEKKLCFGLSDLEILEYIIADFTGDVDDWKSTSGRTFLKLCMKYMMDVVYISCNIAGN